MLLRVAGIVEDSIVDGPGLRLAVFTQGCPHHCQGCHNPETHDPEGGYFLDIREIADRYAQNPLLSGVTFSGGEPFAQTLPLVALARLVHEAGGNVVTYTGYVYEDILRTPAQALPGALELLEATDLLVDGPYVEAMRNLELPFRGSSNQRLLDRNARKEIRRLLS